MGDWQNYDGKTDPLTSEEMEICRYLASWSEQWVAEGEISRRAGGKARFKEDPRWALGPISRLVERALIETDSKGRYRLPRQESLESSADPATLGKPAKSPEPGLPPGPAGAGKKILYVEDDQHWRELVSLYLQECGYEVRTARDGTEAMLGTEGIKLDAIILDLDLAGESGRMLLSFLTVNQVGVPVILYTGGEHNADAITAMLRMGANQYLRKGPLEELRKAVAKACG